MSNLHTLVTIPLANRYGTRLFVMCVCKPIQSAHPHAVEREVPSLLAGKKIRFLSPPRVRNPLFSKALAVSSYLKRQDSRITHATFSSI